MYVSDKHSSWFKLQNNSLKSITFNKYKIVSNNGLDFLKDIYIDYDIPITLIPGQSTIIPLICSPERSFKLNLVTSEDKYISISMDNIIDYKENFCNDLPNPVCLGLKENGIGDSVDNPSIVCDANDLDNIRNGLDKYYLQGNNIDLNVEPYNEETDYDFNIINKYTSSSSYNTNYTSVTQILETKADLLLKEVYYLPYTTGDYKLEIGSTNGGSNIYDGSDVTVSSNSTDYIWDLSADTINLEKDTVYYFKITTPSTRPRTGAGLYNGFIWESNGYYAGTTLLSSNTLAFGIKADYTNGPLFGGWEPILAFSGVFDGSGHTISNLFISGLSDSVGLFGSTTSSSISNLILDDVDIRGGNYVGGLVGSFSGIISNSSVEGVVSGISNVGGLIGYQSSGTITSSSSSGDVSGTSNIGGLVGYQNYEIFSNCNSSANVSGGDYLGGLVGYQASGTVSSCYSTGDVSGGSYLGGLVGFISGTIDNSYSTSSVSGSGYTRGGLVGDSFNGYVVNSYAMGLVPSGSGLWGSDQDYSDASYSYWDYQTSQTGSSCYGIPKTTAQMKTQSTFTNWDFTTVWNITEGTTYPYLRYNTPETLPQ